MKTKLDRVPTELSDMVEKEAASRNLPRTIVYNEIKDQMALAGQIKKMFLPKRKSEKTLLRF